MWPSAARTTRAPPPRRTGGRRCHAGRADLALTAIQNPHFFPRLPSGGEKAGGKKLFHKGPDQQQRPGLRHAGPQATRRVLAWTFTASSPSRLIERLAGARRQRPRSSGEFTSMASKCRPADTHALENDQEKGRAGRICPKNCLVSNAEQCELFARRQWIIDAPSVAIQLLTYIADLP